MVREIIDNNAVTISASSALHQLDKNGELEKSSVNSSTFPAINVSNSGVVNVVGSHIENHYVIKKTTVTLEPNRNTLTAAEKIKNFVFGNRRKRLYVAFIGVTCVLIGAFFGIVYVTIHHDSADDEAPLPNDFSGRFISREYWFASPPRGILYPFKTMPLTLVIVENPRGYQCSGPKYCPGMLKYIQNANFMDGLADIGYNFVIADDGYIYEGRGWDFISNFSEKYNDRSYSVAFLGNYGFICMPERQITAFDILMAEAVKRGKLIENYELCPNPMMRFYKKRPVFFLEEIQKWDHFNTGCRLLNN